MWNKLYFAFIALIINFFFCQYERFAGLVNNFLFLFIHLIIFALGIISLMLSYLEQKSPSYNEIDKKDNSEKLDKEFYAIKLKEIEKETETYSLTINFMLMKMMQKA